jgi:DNA-directed RNA polymerase subunit RPC12/RpoP
MVNLNFPLIKTVSNSSIKKTKSIECPKCGSKDVFKFEKEIYITNNGDFEKKPLYGCKSCESGFVILSGDNMKVKEGPPEVGYEKVQSILGGVSKNCFNILGNIK